MKSGPAPSSLSRFNELSYNWRRSNSLGWAEAATLMKFFVEHGVSYYPLE